MSDPIVNESPVPNGNGGENGAPQQRETQPQPVDAVAVKPEAVKEETRLNESLPAQESVVPQVTQRTPTSHGRSDICRDFMKNICNRGSRCKFFHPQDHNPDSSDEIHFCIDFQNRGCTRDNCRFVHAHRDDAERYKQNGDISIALARAIAAITKKETINGIPFCKEFQTGNCSRVRCRYWHINLEAERERRRRMNGRHFPEPPMQQQQPPYGGYGSPASGGAGIRRPASGPMDYDFEMKRGRYDEMPPPPRPDRYVQELERRNSELSKENEGLKRELERERERYEQLYALFRQSSASIQAHAAPDMYAAAQQHQQPPQMPGMGGPPSLANQMHPRGGPGGVPADVAVRWTPTGGAQSWQ
ncbi:hypothetical protein L596_017194 [Steinernema carpocapsae]|uniref:C3H1-type domain-containing protein n=1 Tax=Steinernema carpocapsae TaxID=34508 RepID=A0A4U5N0Y4_STECR|nr:hypothetical protein L596_017194 [Steinernema carpocapsae]